MELEIQNKVNKFSVKKFVALSLLALIILSLAFTCFSVYRVLSYGKIYKGIYVNGSNVSGMPVDELKSFLEKNYTDNIKGKELVIKYKDKDATEKTSFSDINVTYDIEDTAQKAYDIGRTGGLFDRLVEIIKTSNKKVNIDIPYSFDKKKVDSMIEKLRNSTLINVKEAELLISEDKVAIRAGHHGESIDKDSTFKLIDNAIKSGKIDPVEASVVITPPNKIDVEDYYKKISCDAADAVFKTDGKTYELKPHVVGRSIDKAALASISNELEKTEDSEKVLPVIFTKPKITVDDLNSHLFKDTLSTFSTQFSIDTKNNANRGVNIRLAVSKINGKILAPGDVFSFNQIVGERTAEGGYKEAHTYVGGKVVDGIGGGICQVSTTLYNAVLFSDLSVMERTNHYFTVSYVPLGRDAAVSYGDVDFKFKNSTKWPLKIQGSVTDNNVINFKIIGSNDSPGKEIVINPKIIKTLDFKTEYINDPTKDEGYVSVNTSGAKGYIVDTYKIVKVNNKVVSETKLHTSNYHPLSKEVVRGTKKKGSNPSATMSTPIPTVGVDDADNPPAKPVQ